MQEVTPWLQFLAAAFTLTGILVSFVRYVLDRHRPTPSLAQRDEQEVSVKTPSYPPSA